MLQCSHVMAMAVQKLFPGAQVTIGPAIERGFYYDFDMPEPITEKDLKAVKKEMQRIIKADLPFVKEEVSHCPSRHRIDHKLVSIAMLLSSKLHCWLHSPSTPQVLMQQCQQAHAVSTVKSMQTGC